MEEMEEESEELEERLDAIVYSDDLDDGKKQLYIRQLTQTEGCFEAPINVSITYAKEIQLPPLKWVNFQNTPKKTKVTNTGKTVIFSAKWNEERPYIQDGPFLGKYVFSNWHLHWGKNDMEGSEHTIDGAKYPLELHVVLFKSSYLTQESALKEQDGCSTLVYMFMLQDAPNPYFQKIVDSLSYISRAGASKKIESSVITDLIRVFTVDYFMYWGAVSTKKCTHYILWLITRVPIRVSAEQIDAFRYLYDSNGAVILRNFREIENLNNRSLFHVCPSSSKYSTMLQNGSKIAQVYRCEMFYMKTLNNKNSITLEMKRE